MKFSNLNFSLTEDERNVDKVLMLVLDILLINVTFKDDKSHDEEVILFIEKR